MYVEKCLKTLTFFNNTKRNSFNETRFKLHVRHFKI